ncbi:MAG: hypothetical protein OEZ02_07025 [Anaerolineae bacterium]|nr:hypothetical protein [Anaerolineae bacterium]
MNYIIFALAVYLGLQLIQWAIMTVNLWAVISTPIQMLLDDPIPKDLLPFLDTPVQQLGALGFLPAHDFSTISVLGHPDATILLTNPAAHTCAILTIASIPDPQFPFDVVFYTFFEDGATLATYNGIKHNIYDEFPNTVSLDPYVYSLAQQWEVHQHQLAQMAPAAAPQALTPADYLKTLDSYYAQYTQRMLSKKIWKEMAPRQYRMNLFPAARLAFQALRARRKANTWMSKRQQYNLQHHIEPMLPPVSIEVQVFQKLAHQKRHAATQKSKLQVLLLSLVVFIISFLWLLDLGQVLILVGAVMLHELGHLAAMRLFGYQNLSYFFLPFFGAAVTGQKTDATMLQKILVLFAGPLPGLALGLAAIPLYFGKPMPRPLVTLVLLLIVINYFNLLPFFPLDGGRIIHHLIFSIDPYVESAFKLLGAAAFLLAGFWLGDYILLAIGLLLSIITLANLPYTGIIRRLKKRPAISALAQQIAAGTAVAEDQALTVIFQDMHAIDLGHKPFPAKFAIANGIKEIVQNQPKMHLAVRLALIVFYFAVLIGIPILYIALTWISNWLAG